MLGGVASTFKGQVVGEEFTKWPDQLDFSAELSKARAAKPDAIFVFYPGAAGVQFLTQYAQSGLKGQIPLYTAFTIDETTLPRQRRTRARRAGRAAMGERSAQRGEQEVRRRLPQETSRPVAVLLRRAEPTTPPASINSAVAAVKGDTSKKEEMRKEMEKANFKSVRGNFKFGTNHMPIQNFYLQDVVKKAEGKLVLKTVATIVENNQDRFVNECKMK